jgi:hypothetical protein
MVVLSLRRKEDAEMARIVSSAKHLTDADLEEQRKIVAHIPRNGAVECFAVIGLMWFSPRRASLGIRFAKTTDLTPHMIDDGRVRWQPIEAIAI